MKGGYISESEKSPKSTIIFHSRLQLGANAGISSYCTSLCEILSRFATVRVRNVCLERVRSRPIRLNNTLEEKSYKPVLEIHTFGFSIEYIKQSIAEIARCKKDCQLWVQTPDVYSLLLVLAARFRGLDSVVIHHAEVGGRIGLFLNLMTKITLQLSKCIIVLSESNSKSELVRKSWKQVFVVPHSIDDCAMINREKMSELSSSRFRRKKVAFVGRLVKYKGLKVLCKAMALLEAEYGLTIIGDGPEKEDLRSYITAMGLGKRISVKGEIPEEKKMEELDQASCLILPSINQSEAFGIVQLEGMARGLPMINTWLKNGVNDIGIDGFNAITALPDDVASLAESIQKMFSSEEDYIRMADNSRSFVEEMYSAERVAESLKFLLGEVQR